MTTTPATEHHLLVTHASRWAESKKRRLDTDLLETVLHLVTTYDERSAQAWPQGAARNLVLHRWPANGPSTMPDTEALQATLDTFWRFLRGTGRMSSASAAPADLVKELRRALPQMADAVEDRSNWSQGRVLQDFASTVGIDLESEADSMEVMQERLNQVMAAWNDLPTDERLRLMPDPSPRSAAGLRATDLANEVLSTGRMDLDPDLTTAYPHFRRGIRAVAIREAAESGFARTVTALLEWLGDGKAVTKTGVLRPALAREAYRALDLAPWERRFEASSDVHARPSRLTDDVKQLDAKVRAESIRRAADCVALERVWYAAQATGRIEITSTTARPAGLGGAGADGSDGDALGDAVMCVVAVLEATDWRHLEMLSRILVDAVVAPDGAINLDDVREDHWESAGFADRYGGDTEWADVFRGISDGQVAGCAAMFDDMALWTRRGDDLTITDFGREAAGAVLSLAEDGLGE